MNRLIKTITFTIILTIGIWIIAPVNASQFTLINDSGLNLYELYVSSTSSDDWEEDLLGDDILMDGDRITITISNGVVKLCDLLIVDEVENEFYWEELNLDEISTIRLYCEDDELWAEWE